MAEYTEKKKDKFSREIEKDIQSRLSRVQGAPTDERAHAELDTANRYLKNCETLGDFSGRTERPSRKSDASPNDAEKFFNETQKKFRGDVNRLREKATPEKKKAINRKLFSVGIAFDSQGKAVNE